MVLFICRQLSLEKLLDRFIQRLHPEMAADLFKDPYAIVQDQGLCIQVIPADDDSHSLCFRMIHNIVDHLAERVRPYAADILGQICDMLLKAPFKRICVCIQISFAAMQSVFVLTDYQGIFSTLHPADHTAVHEFVQITVDCGLIDAKFFGNSSGYILFALLDLFQQIKNNPFLLFFLKPHNSHLR